MVKCKFCENGT